MNINDGNIDRIKRRNYLIEQLTVEEKISLLMHESPAIPRLGIKRYNWWNEALHGVARAGLATVFPQAIGLAATFNEKLMLDVANIISDEGRAKYNEFKELNDTNIYKGLTFWSPNINIVRDPRWGRGQETYGEDPVLTSKMATSFIKGIQGNNSDVLKAIATPKHFFAHSGPEDIRHSFDANINEHDLYNTYTYAFRECFRNGHAKSVMTAYNRVNGKLCVGSIEIIENLLRKELSFDGVVVSDCGSINDTFAFHKVVDNSVDAAALSLKAGLDVECGSTYYYLIDAYKEGKVKISDIDKCLTRALDARFELGLFDENIKNSYDDLNYEIVACDNHLDLSRKAAADSFVLLKNDGILPINGDLKLALIGPNIHNDKALIGNYAGTPLRYSTILSAFSNSNYSYRFAEGSHMYNTSLYGCGYDYDSFSEAKIIANKSDIVIMGVGLTAELEGEEGDAYNPINSSGDRVTIELPKVQLQLIKEISKVNKNIVLVNFSGSCIAFDEVVNDVSAILQVWYPGGEGGEAIKQVLEGKLKPKGRLPVTFYSKYNNLPDIKDYSMKNRTYKYLNEKPLYKFGYGLSYDPIVFDNVVVGGKKISFDVKCIDNVIIQVYVKPKNNEIYNIRLVDLCYVESGSISVDIIKDYLSFYNESGELEYINDDFAIIITSRNIEDETDYIIIEMQNMY